MAYPAGQYPQHPQPGHYPPQPGPYPPQYPGSPGSPGQYPPQGQYPQHPQYPQQPGQYPQQPGQYPPQYGQYPYGQQGCCASCFGPPDPNGGCCGPPAPPGASPCPMCCPEDPNEHCCDTSDPTIAAQRGQPLAALSCMWGICDATTWVVLLFLILSVAGFAITVGMKNTDNLLGKFDAESAFELEAKIAPFIDYGVAMPSANETVNVTDSGRYSAGMRSRTGCVKSEKLIGTFGALCAEDTLQATVMLMNQSRWVNFRATLYLLAMLAPLVLLIVIVVVNKQREWVVAGKPEIPPFGGAPGPQYYSPPFAFFATPLYYTFRVAWAAVAVFVILWMADELYQYVWFMKTYKARTTGELHAFWVGFDNKFLPSTIIVGIFLCWPVVHLVLSWVCFAVGIIPWLIIQQVYTQIQNPTIDEEKPVDEHSCCIRTNMFCTEFRQCHRCGFSDGQWTLLTGDKAPFCTCLDCSSPAFNPSFSQQQLGNTPSPAGQPPRGPMPMGQQEELQSAETPAKKKKKKKSKRAETSDDSDDATSEASGQQSKKEKRSSSRSKRRERSDSPGSVHSSQQFASGAMTRGFPGTNTSQNLQTSGSNVFMPAPGGASPTLVKAERSSGAWGSDSEVRKSGSKKKSKKEKRDSDDESEGARERRKAEKKEKKERRSRSSFNVAEDDMRASRDVSAVSVSRDVSESRDSKRDKKEKKEKKEKREKKDKKHRDDE
jgi:hypothetical protein